MTINDFDTCARAARAGIGIVQLPEYIARDNLAAGQLQVLLGDYPSEKVSIYILYLQNRHLSAKVRAFVESTAELFANANFLEPSPGLLRKL